MKEENGARVSRESERKSEREREGGAVHRGALGILDEVYETVKRLHPEGRVYRFEHCGIVQPGSSPKKHCSACGAEIEGVLYEGLAVQADAPAAQKKDEEAA